MAKKKLTSGFNDKVYAQENARSAIEPANQWDTRDVVRYHRQMEAHHTKYGEKREATVQRRSAENVQKYIASKAKKEKELAKKEKELAKEEKEYVLVRGALGRPLLTTTIPPGAPGDPRAPSGRDPRAPLGRDPQGTPYVTRAQQSARWEAKQLAAHEAAHPSSTSYGAGYDRGQAAAKRFDQSKVTFGTTPRLPSAGRATQTGAKGGKYYISSSGEKVYLK